MRRIAAIFCVGILIFLGIFFPYDTAYSDELEEITQKIEELQQQLEASKRATEPLESELDSMTDQLNSLEAQVTQIERDLATKREQLEVNYAKLDEKKDLFDRTVRDYYMKNRLFSPLFILASGTSAEDVTHVLALQSMEAKEEKSLITSLALTLVSIEEQKAKLEDEEQRLAGVKSALSQERESLAAVVKGAKDYQAQVSGEIADLSAKQQEIINARSGGFTFTIGSGELADEYLSSIKGFRESAPSGYFAVFSFGGYTHRKGMSQYGARGRAQSGQNYQQILQAYYGKTPVSQETGGDIQVAGHGSMNFEDRYLLGIAEMPSSWHPEALKAQAVAARTYAYRYKAEGREICTTEACQVFNSGKADNPPQAWRDAVQATRGMILEGVVTYYASTHGGWATPVGWDTTDGQGGSNFIDRAYDKLGGSPWLYKAWWRQGYSNSGPTCGRPNPWLSPQEMADIVNAAIALRDSGGIDTGRITPVTTSCWGGNPYSMDELRSLVSGKGGISSATSVAVSQGNGSTSTVTVNGISFSGEEFKRAFNLRAPGYLSIPQSGFAFFNIENK